MRFDKNAIQDLYEKYPQLTRKDQYRILKTIVKVKHGIFIDEEVCRDICNIQRTIRSVIPREPKTSELEQQAKRELGYAVDTAKKINSLF